MFYEKHLPKILNSVHYFSENLKKLQDVRNLPSYYGHHIDYDLHLWTKIELPKGWTKFYGSGLLKVVWRDHGFGNQKGQIWARVAPNQWHKISNRVASHYWRTDVLHLPKQLFELDDEPATLEIACESHFYDPDVARDLTGYEVHVKEGARVMMRLHDQEDEPIPEDMRAKPVNGFEGMESEDDDMDEARGRPPMFMVGGPFQWQEMRAEQLRYVRLINALRQEAPLLGMDEDSDEFIAYPGGQRINFYEEPEDDGDDVGEEDDGYNTQ